MNNKTERPIVIKDPNNEKVKAIGRFKYKKSNPNGMHKVKKIVKNLLFLL